MRIEDVKKKYKDEWILAEILEEDDLGNPMEVNVLVHSRSRDDIYKALKTTKAKYISTLYTGEIPKEGYAVAFHGIQV